MLAVGKNEEAPISSFGSFLDLYLGTNWGDDPLGHEYQWSTHDVAGEEWLHLKYTGELVYLLNCRLHVLGWMIFID